LVSFMPRSVDHRPSTCADVRRAAGSGAEEVSGRDGRI
jgi:hypothetical protein